MSHEESKKLAREIDREFSDRLRIAESRIEHTLSNQSSVEDFVEMLNYENTQTQSAFVESVNDGDYLAAFKEMTVSQLLTSIIESLKK